MNVQKLKIYETVKGIIGKRLPNHLKVSDVHFKHALKYCKKNCFVLAVTVTLRDINCGKIDTLRLIMKRTSTENKDQRIKISMIKEIQMYNLVLVEYTNLIKFLEVEGKINSNLFAMYYGSDESSENDQEGPTTFLIKDLRFEGYFVPNKKKYLDMNHIKIATEKLAQFHALGIALKQNNPKIFDEDYKNILRPVLRYDNDPKRREIYSEFRQKLRKILNKNEKIRKYSEKVVKLIEIIDEIKVPEHKEPFATVIHNDLWKMNLLFKYDKDIGTKKSRPIDVKLIDFQYCIYNSPIRDLSHLLYSSALPEVFSDFKYLSCFYYDNLIKYLKILKCDCTELTIERYDEEVRNFGWTKIKHTILLNGESVKHFNKHVFERLYYVFLSFEDNGWFDR